MSARLISLVCRRMILCASALMWAALGTRISETRFGAGKYLRVAIRLSKSCHGSTIQSSAAGSNITGGFTARRSARSCANWTESWSFGPSVNTKSYVPTFGELGTGSRTSRVVVQSCLPTGSWHVAWLHDGSRMTRECPVRFCERLGVKLLGATLPSAIGYQERPNVVFILPKSP